MAVTPVPSYCVRFQGEDLHPDCLGSAANVCLSVMRLGCGRAVEVSETLSGGIKLISKEKAHILLRLFAMAVAWTVLLPVTLIGLVFSAFSSSQSALYKFYAASLQPMKSLQEALQQNNRLDIRCWLEPACWNSDKKLFQEMLYECFVDLDKRGKKSGALDVLVGDGTIQNPGIVSRDVRWMQLTDFSSAKELWGCFRLALVVPEYENVLAQIVKQAETRLTGGVANRDDERLLVDILMRDGFRYSRNPTPLANHLLKLLKHPSQFLIGLGICSKNRYLPEFYSNQQPTNNLIGDAFSNAAAWGAGELGPLWEPTLWETISLGDLENLRKFSYKMSDYSIERSMKQWVQARYDQKDMYTQITLDEGMILMDMLDLAEQWMKLGSAEQSKPMQQFMDKMGLFKDSLKFCDFLAKFLQKIDFSTQSSLLTALQQLIPNRNFFQGCESELRSALVNVFRRTNAALLIQAFGEAFGVNVQAFLNEDE